MSWILREFGPDGDYDLMTEVHNQVFVGYPMAAEDFRRQDLLKEEKIVRRYWIAEEAGRPLGISFLSHNQWAFHPRKFGLEAWVIPGARGRGIGTALYDAAMAAAAEFDPIVLRGKFREDWEETRRFVRARGFTDSLKERESRLDIAAHDPDRFAADVRRVEGQGIRLATWKELAAETGAARSYYDLRNTVVRDVPSPDPKTETPFEIWCRNVLEHPRFLPECNVFALDGDRWVGMSNMWRDEAEGSVETGLTGVLRDSRKRGIASALKARCIAQAKKLGFTSTVTWNEENNRGMLGINGRLGFRLMPMWIEIEKVLDAEALAESLKAKELPANS